MVEKLKFYKRFGRINKKQENEREINEQVEVNLPSGIQMKNDTKSQAQRSVLNLGQLFTLSSAKITIIKFDVIE